MSSIMYTQQAYEVQRLIPRAKGNLVPHLNKELHTMPGEPPEKFALRHNVRVDIISVISCDLKKSLCKLDSLHARVQGTS